TILVADQRPRARDTVHRTQFLGRETAFLRGPERLARTLDVPVIFVESKRTGRGHYELNDEWLCEDPRATAEGEITERFARGGPRSESAGGGRVGRGCTAAGGIAAPSGRSSASPAPVRRARRPIG